MANLLVITNWYPQLWTNRYINNFVKEFTDLVNDQFNEIYVISPQPYFPKILRRFKIFEKYYRYSNFYNYSYDNIKVFYPTYFTLPLNIFRKRKNWEIWLEKIKQTINKNNLKFDIIHCHFVSNWMIWVKLKEIYKDSKVIIHCHDSSLKNDLKISPQKYLGIFTWIDASISFCEHHDVINKFLKENNVENKNVYIPNFVNTKRFYPKENAKELKRKYWFNANDKILICIWNLIYEHKWQNDILKIWKDLENEVKNLHLIILWDWPDKSNLLANIKNLSTNKIRYLWPKSNEEIVDYLNISDLFIFPSRYESFWIVQIEAISCWTPAITYKNWWSEYIIKDDKVWTVLNRQDTKLLKEWILKILNTEYDKEYLHQYIVDKYSWEIVKKKLINLYFNH